MRLNGILLSVPCMAHRKCPGNGGDVDDGVRLTC